ncbi:MAG: DUF350 domain-containing protein [Planctomycetota bacterium]|jgi:uncharacterized membrane protein YjfL (UPF0719 family)
MKEYLLDTLTDLPAGAGFVVLGLIVLVLAKIAKDFMTPFKLDQELTARDNPALGLSVTGYYLGVIIVFLGVLAESGEDTLEYTADAYGMDLLEVFLYGLAGIVLLNLGRLIVDKFILSQFSTRKEIIEDRNVGTGAVEFGNYVTSGLIIAGAFHGQGDPFTAVVFFALGEAGLILFSWLYQLFTSYDIHGEIERDNTAAGVALAGNMVAIGIVLLKALKGDFLGWTENITAFVVYAVAGCILLFVVRWIADLFMMPGATFDEEIARDRNINAAWIESAVVIGAASIIFFSL